MEWHQCQTALKKEVSWNRPNFELMVELKEQGTSLHQSSLAHLRMWNTLLHGHLRGLLPETNNTVNLKN